MFYILISCEMCALSKTTQVQFRDCAKIGQAVKHFFLLVTE